MFILNPIQHHSCVACIDDARCMYKKRSTTTTTHTGAEAGDPDVEEVRVRYPVSRLHPPLLAAPGAALAPRRRHPVVADEQRRAPDAAGHGRLVGSGSRRTSSSVTGQGRRRRAVVLLGSAWTRREMLLGEFNRRAGGV